MPFCRLNLLIAIMGDSYEKVKESERVEALRERARIIVEIEKRFSKSHRYQRFMHFLEPTEPTGKSQEAVWEGVTRRVGQMMKIETRKLEEHLDSEMCEVDAKFKLMDRKLEMMNNKFEALDNKLDAMLDRLK